MKLSFIFFLLWSYCLADAVFIPNKQKQYLPGDFIEGTLRYDLNKENTLLEIKGKKISPQIFAYKIDKIGPGEANLILVPLANTDTQKVLEYNGIKIDISKIYLGNSSINPKGFLILEESLSKSFWENLWIWLGIAILLTVICMGLWKIRKNKILLTVLMSGKEKKIGYWKEKITNAQEREDYEFLYRKRKEWSTVLGIPKSQFEEFFDILNKYQYKKNWAESELLEVQKSYLRFKNGI